MSKVAVLGCGPSGLIAAHAAQLRGFDVVIFAPKVEKSTISGAQYLHSAIPGITSEEPDGEITYEHFGNRAGYAEKIYGHHDAPCSWDAYPDRTPVPAWSLQNAYAALWRGYRHGIVAHSVTRNQQTIGRLNLADVCDGVDLVFVTCPRFMIQKGERSEEAVWIKNYDPKRVTANMPDMTIQYNGTKGKSWYRASNIFGHYSVEWPMNAEHPDDAVQISKPLSFEPQEEVPRNVRFLGRYGQWKKGVLVDHVFNKATKILESR